MFIQIGGLTIEADGFLSVRLKSGAEVLVQRSWGAERGLWATLWEPASWQVWAGWFNVIFQGAIDRPSAAA